MQQPYGMAQAKEGSGTVSTKSGVLKSTQYSYKSRFEEGIGTNPEELVAAAHASCFAMKLSFVLGEAGYTPNNLEAKCDLISKMVVLTESHITVKGKVPGISKEKFEECVKNSIENCPISKALSMKISSMQC
jgi:osmotically inducible protein OsmC